MSQVYAGPAALRQALTARLRAGSPCRVDWTCAAPASPSRKRLDEHVI